jgi:transcriptional regulator with XRE-family HTH domain
MRMSVLRKNNPTDRSSLGRRKVGPYDPVDVAVGARLKQRRLTRKVTQEQLGAALGVTFQQVQKYEKGANRLAASTLVRAARVLSVPVAYFFEGISVDPISSCEPELRAVALQQARDFMAIKDPMVQGAVRELIAALADGPDT